MTVPHEGPEHAGSLGRQIAGLCVGLLNEAGIEPRQAAENPLALTQWLSYQLMGLGVPHVIAVGYVILGAGRTLPDETGSSGPRCTDEAAAQPSKQHAWIELRNAEVIDVTLLHRLTPASGDAEATWEQTVLHGEHPGYLALAPLEYRRQGIAAAADGAAPGAGVDERNLQILLRMQELSQRD